MTARRAPKIAIACGGTGGHLFPGIAVAEKLVQRGCRVTLLISPKDVDQQSVKSVSGMEIVTLPAVGLTSGRFVAFLAGFWKSYRAAKNAFRNDPPKAALAMGGFTSAPPILAAKHLGAKTFLHESNTIPGRANRWLSRVVDQAFVGFPQAAARLHARKVIASGTPVRPQFQPRDARECRRELGLDPDVPVVLVVGGSQGATGINNLVINALPLVAADVRRRTGEPANPPSHVGGYVGRCALQFFHLTGAADVERVRRAYAENYFPAVVHPFFNQMDLALGAATIAISRAGASSLAEIAAMRVPSVLIPFPAATDNHQLFNARAFEETGAAKLIEQKTATAEDVAALLMDLILNPSTREKVGSAAGEWHSPKAAQDIAEKILETVTERIGDADLHRKSDASFPLGLNLVAADVSPLRMKAGEIRADSRRLLRFGGSMREIPFWRIFTIAFSLGERQSQPAIVAYRKTSAANPAVGLDRGAWLRTSDRTELSRANVQP